ncbi:MAG: hypothetical protein EXR29_07685 [Betaproteobacteria bacterium]|nr:hypothetical protein [Betaproteobacteria bacterium]
MRSPEKRAAKADLPVAVERQTGNLLEWLFELRDRQRELKKNAAWLIRGDAVPWESNRQGRMQWYLHPAIENSAVRSMMFYRQEIPPRSRSGAQKSPGGAVILVVQGRGYTLLDGVRHNWEAEDVINIPIRTDGVTVQHFNSDAVEPVVMVCADLNLADMLGVDRGAVFEQIENAPE